MDGIRVQLLGQFGLVIGHDGDEVVKVCFGRNILLVHSNALMAYSMEVPVEDDTSTDVAGEYFCTNLLDDVCFYLLCEKGTSHRLYMVLGDIFFYFFRAVAAIIYSRRHRPCNQ